MDRKTRLVIVAVVLAAIGSVALFSAINLPDEPEGDRDGNVSEVDSEKILGKSDEPSETK